MEVHRLSFSTLPLDLGAQDLHIPKSDLEKNKTAINMIPDEKSHGLCRYTTRINMQKNVLLFIFFRRFSPG